MDPYTTEQMIASYRRDRLREAESARYAAQARTAARRRRHSELEINIRALNPGDHAQIAGLFERLSPRSRYQRYLAPIRRLSNSALRHLSTIDHVRHEAFGAFQDDMLVGVAHYFVDGEARQVAEVSLEVADSHQRLGIGSRLLSELALHARRRGICRFTATALAENRAVESMLDGFAWPRTTRTAGHEVILDIQLAAC